MKKHRIFGMGFASVYPHYITKAEKKGRTKAEVDQIIAWLMGYDAAGLKAVLDDKTNIEHFITEAPRLSPRREQITGLICGIRVEEIEDPLMKEIRYLDKLIDELAKGKTMEKILREGGVGNSCRHTAHLVRALRLNETIIAARERRNNSDCEIECSWHVSSTRCFRSSGTLMVIEHNFLSMVDAPASYGGEFLTPRPRIDPAKGVQLRSGHEGIPCFDDDGGPLSVSHRSLFASPIPN